MSRARGPTLADIFDPKRNSLNLVRLVLASLVILTHAAVVTTGSREPRGAFDVFIGQMPVDGFFAVSGFLIAGSWLNNPRSGSFLLARAGRLFPAFWVCLLVTALVFAPVSVIQSDSSEWRLVDSLLYFAKNAGLVIFQNGIPGTLTDVPYPGDWNASLWTLKWEFSCYIAVWLLGLVGLLGKKRVAILLFVVLTAASIVGATDDLPKVLDDAVRFGLMYQAGVLLYLLAPWIRVSFLGLIASAVLITVAAYAAPDYRTVSALPLAYFLVAGAARYHSRRLHFSQDLSYGMYIYGFPVEQLLAGTRLRAMGEVEFAMIAVILTVPCAALSWFVIEKPTLTAIRRHRQQAAVRPTIESIHGG